MKFNIDYFCSSFCWSCCSFYFIVLCFLGFKTMKSTTKRLINLHNCCVIIKFATIIRSTKYGDKVPTCKKFVAIFDNLMSPTHEFNIMLFTELFNNILSKNIANPSLIFAPAFEIIRISPQKVAKQSLIWYIYGPDNIINLREVIKIRRQAPMHANNPLVDDSRDGEEVKHIAKFIPQGNRIPAFAFIVESVHSCD